MRQKIRTRGQIQQGFVGLCEAGNRQCSVLTKKTSLTGEALHELKRMGAQGKGRQGVVNRFVCIFSLGCLLF